MSGTGSPRGRTVGRPPRLSLDAIVAAAERVLAEEGPDKLSMRRLAAELDSAPMALYYHVRDKNELLLLVMETDLQRIERPSFPDDPRDRLIAASVLLHELLAQRPWVVEVLAQGDVIAPSAMWMVEAMIGAAVDHGCPPEEAFAVYRAIWCYILGNLVLRAKRGRAPEAGTEAGVIAALPGPSHPNMSALAPRWPELNARETHREALTAIVDGLLRANGPV